MDGENLNTESNNEESIESIMGGLSDGQKPDEKPGTGEKTEGNKETENKTELPKWIAQLPPELTSNEETLGKLKRFEKIGDVAKALIEYEGKLGNSIAKPNEKSTPEELENFYRSIGKPENVEGYSIKGDETKVFRDIAFKNNLTDTQASNLFEALKQIGESELAKQKETFTEQAKQTQQALKSEYGKDYPVKMEMLKRGVKAYAGKGLGAKLQQSGLLADAEVVKMFILLGEQASESGAPTKMGGKINSYKSIKDGGTLSFGNDFK